MNERKVAEVNTSSYVSREAAREELVGCRWGDIYWRGDEWSAVARAVTAVLKSENYIS